jgi:hypothetical protein
MAPWLRAVLLGFLSWFIPFGISFALFPVRKSNAPLFASLMFLIVLVTAGSLLSFQFLHRKITVSEAGMVGLLWLVINLGFDFPMFSAGPMKMNIAAYYSEIGLVYLTFPFYALLAARLATR